MARAERAVTLSANPRRPASTPLLDAALLDAQELCRRFGGELDAQPPGPFDLLRLGRRPSGAALP
jgi:hypothetical protein